MAQTENAIVTGYRYDDPLEPFADAYDHRSQNLSLKPPISLGSALFGLIL